MEGSNTDNPSCVEQQTVVFRLGLEQYGIDIFRVSEIVRLPAVTPVPRTEPHVRGLANLRGKTIPVVDIRIRMNLLEVPDTGATRMIVVETSHGIVGVVVDSVTEVVSLSQDWIDDAPKLVNDGAGEFVRGVARRDCDLITLLDIDVALAA